MPKTKRTTRRTRGGRPSYVIIGKGGQILVVSGVTGQISELDKSQWAEVLKLVRTRQQIGKKLGALLNRKGFVLADEVVIDLEV